MKKKLALIFTIVSLFLSMSAFASYENVSINDKLQVLKTFEITEISDESALSEKITRRDFFIMIGKMLDINLYKMDEDRYYRDITSDDRAWNVANALVERGILTVGEDRLLRPDDVITAKEAACVIMKVLGVRNIDYNMYFDMAVNCEILDGIVDSEFTNKDAVTIIYNALNTNTFNYSGTDGYKQGDKTLMEVLYDLYYVEGYVNSVNNTDVYDNSGNGINTIKIGDTVLNCELADGYQYLGCYVSAFYTDIDDTYTLVNIFVNDKKTEKLTVSADDFKKFDKDTYTVEYYVSGSKTKTLDIEKGATVIKNGDNDTSDIEGAFNSLINGEISFINSDTDNAYELIIINSYENIVVRHIDTEDSVIYGKYANIIDLSDENTPVQIISATGEVKSINDIAVDNVISYYESDNLKKLVVSANGVTGTIDAVVNEDEDLEITINGKEYKVDSNFVKNSVVTLNPGSDIIALVDAKGKIADLEITKNAGAFYAYLVNTMVDTDTDDRLKLRVFTENSALELLSVAQRVNVDGFQYDNYDDILSALENANGNVDDQLVLIKKNADGEISYIDTTYEGNEKSGLFVSAKESTQTFFANQMLLGPMIRINSSSKLFVVPQSGDYKNDARAYKVINSNSFFSDWKSYAVTGYRNGMKNTVGYVEAMVLKRDLIGTGFKTAVSNILVVKNIQNVWDEDAGDVRKQIVFQNGKSDSIYVCSEEYDVLTDTNVRVGNLVKISTNPQNEMVSSELIYGEGKKETKEITNWTVEGGTYACGYVFDIRDGIVGLSPSKDSDPFINLATTNIPVMVYDPSLKESVFLGNEGDLIEAMACDYKVVANVSRGVTKSFTVIKELS